MLYNKNKKQKKIKRKRMRPEEIEILRNRVCWVASMALYSS